MSAAIEAMKDSKGTLKAPAKTCKHLAHLHQDYESGNYHKSRTTSFCVSLKSLPNNQSTEFRFMACLAK